MNKWTRADLLNQLNQWHDDDEFSSIIKAIEAIPEDERDFRLTLLLARAYSNLAVLGDKQKHREDNNVDMPLLKHSIDLLESIRAEGESDPQWNARMAYAYELYEPSIKTAYNYAQRWLLLDPENPLARDLMEFCESELKEEENSEGEEDDEEEEDVFTRPTLQENAELIDRLQHHIDSYFGEPMRAMRYERVADRPIDILLIPPRVEHDYYTFVTIGVSKWMRETGVWDEDEVGLEFLINLPKTWDVSYPHFPQDEWHWPVDMLLTAAERAIEDPESAESIPLPAKTGFKKAITLHPAVFGFDSFVCQVPKDDLVEFYQLIPLFEEESDLIEKQDVDAFLDLCHDKHLEVINPKRQNVVLDQDEIEDNATEMDKGEDHLQKIAELGLPVDDICAFNHMAMYLYWSIQHDLMSNPFNHKYVHLVNGVKSGMITDLREFIRDGLNGRLETTMYGPDGAYFAIGYNQGDRSKRYVYLRDYRNYALSVLQRDDWRDVEEEEAAYLLLPFTEEHQAAVGKLIDERFAEYLKEKEEETDDERPRFKVATADAGKVRMLDNWDGPLYVYCSDRIAEEGIPAGWAKRIEPDPDHEGWESGWFFIVGDEAELYGEEYAKAHCAFYDLREICSIDPLLVEILKKPAGTLLRKLENGQWIDASQEEDDEEEGYWVRVKDYTPQYS